jgi:hypothetical protein
MGKSDSIIFNEYKSVLSNIKSQINSVAFLGFSQENDLTKSIVAKTKSFYDLSLGNWDINSDWTLDQKYDLIVSTRCPYFSKDPKAFIKKCKNHLTERGYALIDWGLGDHWRFKDYKVGWLRHGELEFAYKPTNFLYSCYWHDDLLLDQNVNLFWDSILLNPEFGYTNQNNLKEVVEKEIPYLVNYKVEKIKTVFLWPERPQLYIITLIRND